MCAHKAVYTDSYLKSPVKEFAEPFYGKNGTVILVKFRENERALKSSAEEHNKIVDVVSKLFTIILSTVRFGMMFLPEGTMHVETTAASTVLDNIRILYGGRISRYISYFT